MEEVDSAPPARAGNQKNHADTTGDRLYAHITFSGSDPHRSQAEVLYTNEPPHSYILPHREYKHRPKKRRPDLCTQFKTGPDWKVRYA